MNIEEKMMPVDEWNKQFSCKYMQQPISFLTEENLDRLQQHCEKTIQYGNGRILEEHQVTLELIIRYRELKQKLEKEKEKNKPDCAESIERTEKMVNMRWVNYHYISKDKIKSKIEELEKEQEDNRKVLYNAVNNLCFKEIDKICNRISVNMAIRDILQSLLKEE